MSRLAFFSALASVFVTIGCELAGPNPVGEPITFVEPDAAKFAAKRFPTPTSFGGITPAHEGSQLTPAIPSILIATKMGFTAVDRVPVCVSHYNQKIDSKEFLLDLKIALAAWLSNSGASEKHWNLMEFNIRSSCQGNNPNYQIRLVWEDPNKQFGEKFPQKKLVREFLPNGMLFKSPTMKAGRGGGGRTQIQVSKRGEKITMKYISMLPSSLRLNPHFDFRSLIWTFRHTDAPKALKSKLIDEYKKLKKLKNPTFYQLSSFYRLMEANRLGTTSTDFAKDGPKQILKNNRNKKSVTYRPIYPYFNIVLHEVGHQMGLLHNKSENSVMHRSGDLFFLTKNDKEAMLKVWKDAKRYLENPPILKRLGQQLSH